MQVSLQSSTKKIKTQMYDIKLLNIYFISTNFFCDPINLINNLIIVTVIVILLFSVCFLVVSFFCDFRFLDEEKRRKSRWRQKGKSGRCDVGGAERTENRDCDDLRRFQGECLYSLSLSLSSSSSSSSLPHFFLCPMLLKRNSSIWHPYVCKTLRHLLA